MNVLVGQAEKLDDMIARAGANAKDARARNAPMAEVAWQSKANTLREVRAAMTEVDLEQMADDYSADEREPWHDRQAYRRAIRDVLDRIKEGK